MRMTKTAKLAISGFLLLLAIAGSLFVVRRAVLHDVDGRQPQEVVRAFLDAVIRKDFESANKLTRDAQLIASDPKLMSGFIEFSRHYLGVKTYDISLLGMDKGAHVFFFRGNNDGQTKEYRIYTRKIDDRWRVVLNPESFVYSRAEVAHAEEMVRQLARKKQRLHSFDESFAFVFIDQPTEEEFKGPPFDRSLYARVLDRCRELGAKGVVIKLFLDRAYSESGDEALAVAMSHLPVVLQARLEPGSGTPDDLPEKFAFGSRMLAVREKGDRGWIPLPRFVAVAADIGFVDFADENIPLLERYHGRIYKSVVVCALELQTGKRARLEENGELMLGDRSFRPKADYTLGIKRSLAPLPAHGLNDLLSGKIGRAEIQDKVVILGWVGSGAGVISTPEGAVPVHVYFGQCLRAVFESVYQD